MKPLHVLAWTASLAALAGAAWLAVRPQAVPADLAEVERGPLVVTVSEDGRTRLKDRYVVSAPLAGLADRITLRAGDPVDAAQTVIVRIAPTEPELLDERARAQAEARVRAADAAVARAVPELARAQAEYEHYLREYERIQEAVDSGAGTVRELDGALVLLRVSEHTRDAARFDLEIARYELEQARAALVRNTAPLAPAVPAPVSPVPARGDPSPAPEAAYEVLSPITGKVLRVLRESAGIVAPGDPLIELGSLDALEVEVDVLSDQAVRVRPGARVSLERWGGQAPLAGVVRTVEPSGFMKISALGVEEQRVNVIIDFVDPPEARPSLGDNFRVEARIVVWEAPDVLLLPVGALFRRDDHWAVFVVDGGRARLQAVDIGERSDRFAQVLGGVEAGQTVILYPSDRVAEQVRITPRSQ